MVAELPDHPIDIYKETATNQIAVKWKHEVTGVEDLFTDKGISLTWSYDMDDDWTVYQAESVAEANAIMKALLNIINGKPAGVIQYHNSCVQMADGCLVLFVL